MSAKQPLNKSMTRTKQYNDERSIESLFDDFQNNQYEQKLDKLVDILLKIISSQLPNNQSKKKDSSLSQNFVFIGLLVHLFFVVILTISAATILFTESKTFLLLMFLKQVMLIIYPLLILETITKLIGELASFIELSDKDRLKLIFKPIKGNFAIDQFVIQELQRISSLEDLKSYEIDLERHIRDTQSDQKVIYNLLLVAPILITLTIIPFYGDNLVNTINNTSLIPLEITSIALYSSIIAVANSWWFKGKLGKLNKCLSYLKKAQVKQNT